MLADMRISFDAALMRRYDGEGPRYTSYPTVLSFREDIGAADLARAARGSPGALESRPLSVYVHMPFCSSPCFYCGCNKVVTRDLGRIDRYVGHLGAEIDRQGALFGNTRSVEQLHFGGGTPTYLPQRRLIELVDRLDSAFTLSSSESRDFSIEIDPRTANPETLRLLAALGFNRLSLGVQDIDEEVQRAVNRVQDLSALESTYQAARTLGFHSINFDLIYGLPRQTLESFSRTLEQVVAMRPDRLAVYGYAHMPERFVAQRQIRAEELPSPALRLELLGLATERLTGAGYRYIGMDHFALPEDSLSRALEDGSLRRCFQGYTTHAEADLVALGVSAIARIGDLYVQNEKRLADYEAALEHGRLPIARGLWMDDEDRLRKDVIHSLMCRGVIDMASIERTHGIDFTSHFAAELDRLKTLADDGLVEIEARCIALTPRGRLLMRTVAMTFDARLPANRSADAPAASRMSRTI
jgi:oxygen-independent coproporphyrinogen-3 oxidase